jgi:hypothetical protein
MLNVLHKVDNVGATGHQSKTLVTGGNKLKFGANNIIDIRYSEVDTDKDGKPNNGYILHIENETSELGPPDIKADAYLQFGKGLHASYELLFLTTQTDTNRLFGIDKSGSWYKIDTELTGTDKPVSVQGIYQTADWLDQNPKVYQNLYKAYATACWPNAAMYK